MHATLTAAKAAIRIGGCPECGFRVAFPATHTTGIRTSCPQCHTQIRLTLVVGTVNDRYPCDTRCQYAYRKDCTCSCGGENHGAGYIHTEQVPTWVRERDAKRADDKKARAQAAAERKRQAAIRRRDDLIATHPDLAALLGDRYADEWGFAGDMRDALRRGDMTDRQITAAVNMVRRDREHDARRQAEQQQAEAALAAGVHHPTGRVEVTGTILTVRYQEAYHYYGTGCHKMLMQHPDGWKVWVTVPAKMEDAAFPEGRTMDSVAAWRRSLPGQTVTLRGTVVESRDGDPLFAIMKRPTLVAGPTPA